MSPPELKLPRKLKPFIPQDEVLEDLERLGLKAPLVLGCLTCDQELKLVNLDVEASKGILAVYFPRVPGYKCDSCEKTYFPEGVQTVLDESARSEFSQVDLGGDDEPYIMQVTRVRAPLTEWQPRLPDF